MVPPSVVKCDAVFTGEVLVQLMRTGPSPSALQVTEASWCNSMWAFSGGGENFNFSENGQYEDYIFMKVFSILPLTIHSSFNNSIGTKFY